jgi:hypothetical protein
MGKDDLQPPEKSRGLREGRPSSNIITPLEADPLVRNSLFSRSDGCPLAPSNDIYFLAADLWLSQSVSHLWKTTSS